jgi:ribosomal-protein-alanine N-acetyltransferase
MNNEIKFPDKFPLIETERLILREIVVNDRVDMFKNYSDVDVAKWFFQKPLDSIEQVDDVIKVFQDSFSQQSGMTWAIGLKETGKYLGTCGYEKLEINHFGEIGFDLAKEYWRRGYMSETLKAIINFGFVNMGLLSIIAHTYSTNIAARQLLEKLQFKVDMVKEDAHHYILTRRI